MTINTNNTNMRIILTPINTTTDLEKLKKDPKKVNTIKARIDYEREKVRFDLGMTCMWDDSRYNNARVGYRFGFVNQIEDRIELFTITEIRSWRDRPNFWNIPEHQRRNLLILSPKEGEISYSEYKSRVGWSDKAVVIGTNRYKWFDSN